MYQSVITLLYVHDFLPWFIRRGGVQLPPAYTPFRPIRTLFHLWKDLDLHDPIRGIERSELELVPLGILQAVQCRRWPQRRSSVAQSLMLRPILSNHHQYEPSSNLHDEARNCTHIFLTFPAAVLWLQVRRASAGARRESPSLPAGQTQPAFALGKVSRPEADIPSPSEYRDFALLQSMPERRVVLEVCERDADELRYTLEREPRPEHTARDELHLRRRVRMTHSRKEIPDQVLLCRAGRPDPRMRGRYVLEVVRVGGDGVHLGDEPHRLEVV